MSERGEQGGPGELGECVPAYRKVRVVVEEDSPTAVLADVEAWEARERYPELLAGGGPLFMPVRELESGGWKILTSPDNTPQSARDGLGTVFRRRAEQAGQSGDTIAQREWQAAAERLDWEAVDELTVLGSRFRMARAEQFIRMGPSGPEPPRPSDPDPAAVGQAHKLPSRTRGFVIDPFVGTGLSESILRVELLAMVRKAGTVPDDVREDSRRAVRTHPGGVLLPAEFMTAEFRDGTWGPSASSSSTPQGTRDALAMYLRVLAPVMERLDTEARAAYAGAADMLDAERPDELEIAGIPTRVVRVERLVRIGPDGPEGPRPSDPDPDLPPALHTQQLRERGLLLDDDDDARYEPSPEAKEFTELLEQERRRAERAERAERERRGKRRGGPRK
jgi:hypothetical protein